MLCLQARLSHTTHRFGNGNVKAVRIYPFRIHVVHILYLFRLTLPYRYLPGTHVPCKHATLFPYGEIQRGSHPPFLEEKHYQFKYFVGKTNRVHRKYGSVDASYGPQNQ